MAVEGKYATYRRFVLFGHSRPIVGGGVLQLMKGGGGGGSRHVLCLWC